MQFRLAQRLYYFNEYLETCFDFDSSIEKNRINKILELSQNVRKIRYNCDNIVNLINKISTIKKNI